MKKSFKSLASVVLTAAALSTSALAEWAPSGPIQLGIAFAAGGGADTTARLIAEDIEAAKGWKFIPQQITGGGGAKLANELRSKPADGLSIGMVVTETLGYNNISDAKANFDHTNFTNIATTAGFDMGVVARSDRGFKDLGDLLKAAKAGETIRFGAASPRLADLAFMLAQANDVEFNIIEVKGGKAVLNGLAAGDMDAGWVAGAQAKGVRAGDLTNLASGKGEPLAMQPEAPLTSEFGLKFPASGYFMFIAPAGLPQDARDALAQAIEDVVTDPTTKSGALIKKAFGKPAVIAGADLDALIEKDRAEAKELLAAVNAQ